MKFGLLWVSIPVFGIIENAKKDYKMEKNKS